MSPSSYDDFPSLPSMPTVRAGDARDALGRIDHYDLLRKLGGGGFGVVYLARDTASGVEVAIKTLHPLLKANAEDMESLRDRFALVSRLSHPNIASALVLHPVRDVNVWDDEARRELQLSPGDSVMVMRYAPGITLSRWRRQFPNGIVPLEQALEIGRQLASALDYAHGERIVHRDIKPANVMVETPPSRSKEEGRSTKDEGQISPSTNQLSTNQLASSKIHVRILDFGLAAEIRSSMSRVSTETGDTSGTRPYMAPEQWVGRRQDGRTDQYALACVLYELLSGAPPFAGVFETGDPVVMMATVKGEAPEEIEGVPPHVNTALQRALSKDPKDRFPSCSAFIEALAAPESRPLRRIPAPETRTPQAAAPAVMPPRQPPKKRRWAGWGWVVALLVVAAVGLLLVSKSRKTIVVKPAGTVVSLNDESLEAKAAAEQKAREEAERKAREEAEAKAEVARRAALLAKGAGSHAGEGKEISVGSEKVALRWCPATTSAEWRRTSGKDTFTMGSPSTEEGRYDVERKHEVRLTQGFWLGETEVTQGLWKEVMDDETVANLARKGLQDDTKYNINGKMQTLREFWGLSRDADPMNLCGDLNDKAPVYNVSWDDAARFCRRLTDRARAAGRLPEGWEFRLPTEAQWEYACRAGTTASLPNGKEIRILGENNAPALDGIAWYGGNSSVGFEGRGWDTSSWKEKQYPGGRACAREVRGKAANAWGLYDMLGNVWEWCADWYDDYPPDAVTNPAGPFSGSFRVYRGGSWHNRARNCRPAYRGWSTPGRRVSGLGLRVALLPVQ